MRERIDPHHPRPDVDKMRGRATPVVVFRDQTVDPQKRAGRQAADFVFDEKTAVAPLERTVSVTADTQVKLCLRHADVLTPFGANPCNLFHDTPTTGCPQEQPA